MTLTGRIDRLGASMPQDACCARLVCPGRERRFLSENIGSQVFYASGFARTHLDKTFLASNPQYLTYLYGYLTGNTEPAIATDSL